MHCAPQPYSPRARPPRFLTLHASIPRETSCCFGNPPSFCRSEHRRRLFVVNDVLCSCAEKEKISAKSTVNCTDNTATVTTAVLVAQLPLEIWLGKDMSFSLSRCCCCCCCAAVVVPHVLGCNVVVNCFVISRTRSPIVDVFQAGDCFRSECSWD